MTDVSHLKIELDKTQAARGVNDLERDLKGLDGQARRTSSTIGGVGKSASRAGMVFSGMGIAASAGWAAVAAGAVFAVKGIFDVNREYQMLQANLVTVAGSTQVAAAQFKALQDFAAKTPFDLAGITDAFTRMQAYGLSTSEATLTNLGNMAAGMNRTMTDVVEAVADATMGEFERLKGFSIKARKEGDMIAMTFGGVTTKVKNNAADIQAYVENIGATEFAGGMERQAATIGGAFDSLKDKIKNSIAEFGNNSGFNSAAASMINGLSKLIDELKVFYAVIGENAAIQKLGKMLTSAGKAISDFMNSTVTLGSTTGTVWEMIGAVVTTVSTLVINYFSWMAEGLAGVYTAWSEYSQQIVLMFQGFFGTGIGKFIVKLMTGIVNALIAAVKIIGVLIMGVPKAFFQAFGAAGKIANSFFSRLKSLLSGNVGAFAGFWGEAAAAASAPIQTITAGVGAISDAMGTMVEDTGRGVISHAADLDRMVSNTLAAQRRIRANADKAGGDPDALNTSADPSTRSDTPSNGSDRAGRDASRDAAQRLKEFQDRVKSLTETYMPAIAKQRELADTMAFFERMSNLGTEGLRQYGLTLQDVAVMAERAGKAIMESVGSKALDDLAFEAGTIRLSAFSDVQSTVEQQYREIARSAEQAHEVIDAGLESEIRNRLTANEQARRAVDAAKELADANKALRENVANEVQDIRDRISLMGTYGEAADRAADALDFRRATERSGADIATQAQAIRDYGQAIDELTARKAELNTFAEGAKRALTEFADEARDVAGRSYDMIRGITDGLVGGIEKALETGKFSFQDFLKVIAQEMARFAAKGAVMLFFKLFTSLMGGGGPLGSIFGGFFAEGGTPPVGKVSVVGERGPELFVPKTLGTVVPNNRAFPQGKSGGGSTVFSPNITISISGSNWTPADADALGNRIVNDVMQRMVNETRHNGALT